MGKKSTTSTTSTVSEETAKAMQKEAELNQQAQDWYESEVFPWVKEQTEVANEQQAADSEKFREDSEWWKNYYRENSDQYSALSDAMYEHYKNNYQPVEDELLDQASNFNKDAYAQRQAGYAVGDLADDYASQRQDLQLQMANAGYDPTSGAYQARMSQLNDKQAAAKASAIYQAKQAADNLGWSKNLYAASQGQGYITNALNTAATANNSASTYGSLMSNSLNAANEYSQNAINAVSNLAQLGISNFSSLSSAWNSYASTAIGKDTSNTAAQNANTASSASNYASNVNAAATLGGAVAGYAANKS